MKTIKHVFLILTSLFLASCESTPNLGLSPKSKEKDTHQGNVASIAHLSQKEIILLDEPFKVPREFEYLMSSVFGSYMGIGEALINGDTMAASKAAETMEFLLGFANKPSKEDRVAKAWASHKESYVKNLKEFQYAKNMKEKHMYFSRISETLYCTFKSFEMDIGDVYVSYCPMALENQGAYWLTDEPRTGNPYFREDVLRCLEKIEVIP